MHLTLSFTLFGIVWRKGWRYVATKVYLYYEEFRALILECRFQERKKPQCVYFYFPIACFIIPSTNTIVKCLQNWGSPFETDSIKGLNLAGTQIGIWTHMPGLEPDLNPDWDLNPCAGTSTHGFKLESVTLCLDSLKFRFFMSPRRRNSARDKVMGEKYIY